MSETHQKGAHRLAAEKVADFYRLPTEGWSNRDWQVFIGRLEDTNPAGQDVRMCLMHQILLSKELQKCFLAERVEKHRTKRDVNRLEARVVELEEQLSNVAQNKKGTV